MPKIKTYGETNLEYQAGGLTSSAGLARSGEMGRAVQRLGGEVGEIGDAVYKRQSQEETSDLNAAFSDLSADVTVEVDELVQNGTIDAQKYSETVNKRVDELGNNISTREGRMAYERNAARLKAQAYKRAARGQAAVAGAKATANLTQELSNYSSSLFSDPSEFQTNYDAFTASLSDQVNNGALPAAEAEKLRLSAGKDMAKSAMRGWAQLDPDIAEKKLKKGEFDGYLDGEAKSQMQTYIDQRRNANEAKANQAEANQRRAQKLREDAFIDKNIRKIVDGTLSVDEIFNSPDLSGRAKEQIIEKVKKHAKDGGGRSDPAVYTNISSRILLPEGDPNKISDSSQILSFVGKGLTMKDWESLNNDLQKTPDGQAMRASKQSAQSVAKSAILQKKVTGFFGSGQYSSESQAQLQNWTNDVRALEQKFIEEKKNPRDLYDPRKPDYVGRPEFLSKYRIQLNSPQYFNSQAQDTLAKQPVFNGGSDPSKRQKKADGTLESIPEWEARKKAAGIN